MEKRTTAKWLGLGLAAMILAGCGDSAEIEAISEKLGLSETEQYAFMICQREMKVKLPAFDRGGQPMRLTELPVPICGCQAKGLAAAFGTNPQIKAAIPIFVSYATKAKKKRMPRFPEDTLVKGLDNNDTIGKLWATLDSCTTNYLATIKDKDRLAALLVPIVKKDKKGGHDAAPAKAAAAPKAEDKKT
jgi:hypothetical protein